MPELELVANNYGADHINRIHSDEGAALYGFAGALVPGVGIYAYLARPIVDLLGIDWLARGSMSAKFLKPVYHAEKVRIVSRVINRRPVEVSLELFNPSDLLCATGTASLPDDTPQLDPADYAHRDLPPPDRLRPATIEAFKPGDLLGSLDFALDLDGELSDFLDDVVDRSPVYRQICHPAYWISKANEIIMHNVALGSWIHTSSKVRHYALAENGEILSLRGRVIEAWEKRGHELITVDLGLFGESDRSIAHIIHSAIIRLRE